MGFFSKITGFDLINDKLLGGDAKDAAKKAAQQQAQSADQAIAFQRESRDLAREDLSPFVNMGQGQINALLAMLSPQGQADYVQNNPLFNASLDSVNKATMANMAARGKLGSGGTLAALHNNYMSTAMPYVQNQLNNLFNAVNMGQSAAAGQANTALTTGNTISDLFTQKGNAIAAGTVGAANARQSAINNLMNLGGQMGAAAMGAMSDERLKTDIKEVGRDELGGIYEFRYLDDKDLYIGRMAQELQKTRPDAVFEHESGYLMVSPEFAPKRAA